MASAKTNLEELYTRLSLEEEDEGGVIIENKEIQGRKETFILVGKF